MFTASEIEFLHRVFAAAMEHQKAGAIQTCIYLEDQSEVEIETNDLDQFMTAINVPDMADVLEVHIGDWEFSVCPKALMSEPSLVIFDAQNEVLDDRQATTPDLCPQRWLDREGFIKIDGFGDHYMTPEWHKYGKNGPKKIK